MADQEEDRSAGHDAEKKPYPNNLNPLNHVPASHSLPGLLPTNNRFFQAAAEGDIEKVKFFLTRRELNEKDEAGNTALHHAAWSGQLPIVSLLLSRMLTSDVNAKNADGSTPLHFAVARGKTHIAVIEALMRFGADMTAKNHKGNTPQELVKNHRDFKNNRQILIMFELAGAKRINAVFLNALRKKEGVARAPDASATEHTTMPNENTEGFEDLLKIFKFLVSTRPAEKKPAPTNGNSSSGSKQQQAQPQLQSPSPQPNQSPSPLSVTIPESSPAKPQLLALPSPSQTHFQDPVGSVRRAVTTYRPPSQAAPVKERPAAHLAYAFKTVPETSQRPKSAGDRYAMKRSESLDSTASTGDFRAKFGQSPFNLVASSRDIPSGTQSQRPVNRATTVPPSVGSTAKPSAEKPSNDKRPCLQPQQLGPLFQAMGMNLTSADLEAVLRLMDLNQDGVVTADDFSRSMFVHNAERFSSKYAVDLPFAGLHRSEGKAMTKEDYTRASTLIGPAFCADSDSEIVHILRHFEVNPAADAGGFDLFGFSGSLMSARSQMNQSNKPLMGLDKGLFEQVAKGTVDSEHLVRRMERSLLSGEQVTLDNKQANQNTEAVANETTRPQGRISIKAADPMAIQNNAMRLERRMSAAMIQAMPGGLETVKEAPSPSEKRANLTKMGTKSKLLKSMQSERRGAGMLAERDKDQLSESSSSASGKPQPRGSVSLGAQLLLKRQNSSVSPRERAPSVISRGSVIVSAAGVPSGAAGRPSLSASTRGSVIATTSPRQSVLTSA